MKALSLDLRKRIVRAIKEEKQTRKAVAARFQVSESSVGKYLRLDKKGKLEAKKHPGQPAWLNEENCKLLEKQVEEYPDWTLEEHSEQLYNNTGMKLAISTIHKYLDKMDLSLKKRTIKPQKQMKN